MLSVSRVLLRTQVVLAIGVGCVIALAEAVVVGTGETGASLGGAAIVALGLAAGAGLLLGPLQTLALWLWGSFARRAGIAQWWTRATDPEGDRDPVIAFHAAAASAFAGVLGFAAFVWLVVPRLLAIDNAKFAQTFGVILLGLALMGTFAAGGALAVVLARLFERLDERRKLPWPRSGALRYIVFVLVPCGAVLVPFVLGNKTDLGTFALPFWLILLFVLEGACLLAVRAVVPKRGATRLQWAVIVAGLAAVVGAAVVLGQSKPTMQWVRTTTFSRHASAALQKLTDVDRDGYSSMFGEYDCAPFDAQINPRARDEPGNGIDENCDGEDSVVADTEELAQRSGVLTDDQKKHYNVVLVVIDAVRADYTGMGGSKKGTTPYLDAIGKESLVFTNAYSQSSATQMAFPAILTGREPSSLNWRDGKRVLIDEGQPGLATLLREAGYATGIIAVNYFEDYLLNLQDEYEWSEIPHRRKVPEKSGWFRGLAAANVVEAIRYLEGRQDDKRPSFLTVYITDPHSPYSKHSFGISTFKGKKKQALYAGEISHVDRQIGFLVEYLKHTRQWDDTIFIMTSDHGEEFGEHGGTKHARTCYIESMHVPLVVKIPGIKRKKVSTPVALVDIVPTVLEVLDIDKGTEALTGQSLLVPALAPELRPDPRYIPCSVISQKAKQGNYYRRAVRTDDMLLVHNVIEGSFELYDTENDPKEKSNVYDERKDEPSVVGMREFLVSSQTGNLADHLMTN